MTRRYSVSRPVSRERRSGNVDATSARKYVMRGSREEESRAFNSAANRGCTSGGRRPLPVTRAFALSAGSIAGSEVKCVDCRA